MEMKVERISKEMIKPSSPTPPHLRNHKLSLLDQIAIPSYVNLIFFYPQEVNHHNNKSALLKQSLSNILTVFYPLAGRVNENYSSIDCNDSGVEFVETRVVGARLSEVLEVEPNKQLQPLDDDDECSPSWRLPHVKELLLLAVKLSLFECGGIALGVSLNHKVGDTVSLVSFMNAWAAATCRTELINNNNNNPQPAPIFDLASFCPPRDRSELEFILNADPEEDVVTSRLVISKEKIAELRKSAASESTPDPTRVESVCGFILRGLMDVAAAKSVCPFLALTSLDLRPRNRPPFPQGKFGNCTTLAEQTLDGHEDYPQVVTKLSISIRGFGEQRVREMGRVDYLDQVKSSEVYAEGGVNKEGVVFSSWCRFPVYDVDFGWGRPQWVCTTTMPYKNVVILMSSACGEGIEAWLNMARDDMNMIRDHMINILNNI